ncbi:NUDIX hydrolase [Phenylobacterium montanum]|uniref:NUDIX domain-containing protein n=1 Tax=Phenylobacterium montanum TaxID=2823693 RepID=A0A975FZB3_9CAUL|nr:NUDIX domain-containing protein [Caulobacter sp. S6]QUD87921.1 NUDIX domain-containing protein [Caulobacter sp. S6]
MSEPATVRPAATILLVRDQPEFEVLMVKRHHQIDFASGALVFPGGKTDPSDHDPAWEALSVGWAETPADERPLRIAAIREAFEEASILVARHPSGDVFHGDERAAAARAAVSKGEESLMGLVRELDLRLDLPALTVFARWITPTMMPKRFDTWFYVVRANSDQLAVCDGWETVDAEWIAPGEAIRLAQAGERTVIFPTRMNLQLLAEAESGEDAVRRAGARTLVTVLPKVESREGEQVLVIPPDAGYGAVAEPLAAIRG